jgi:carbon monoxide dehydrogenase subunit G
MPRIDNEIVIERSPDDVWAVLGDLTAVAEWVPGVESARIDRMTRVCRLADGGGEIHEQISELDDERRSYAYAQTVHPLGLRSSRGSLRVAPEAARSRVSWRAEVEFADDQQERQFLPMLEGGYRAALEQLKARVER